MTGRMSFVDLAWPWGLVTLGLQPLLSPDQDQVEPTPTPTYTLCRLKMLHVVINNVNKLFSLGISVL